MYDKYGRVWGDDLQQVAYSARSYGILHYEYVGLNESTNRLFVKNLNNVNVNAFNPIRVVQGQMSETYYIATKNQQELLNIDRVTIKPLDKNVEFSKNVRTATLTFGEYKLGFRVLGNSSPGLKYINWGDLT